jgi:transposase
MRIFKISRDSIGRWCRQFKQTGNIEPSPRRPHKTRKVDIKQLVALLEARPDATLSELAEPFGVAHSVIDYHLRKLKITRKKNHALRRTRRGKKAQLRAGN